MHVWAYYTNVKAVLLFTLEKILAIYCKTMWHSYHTHLRGRNQRLGITALPESFLFLIYGILALIGMDRRQKNNI